MKSSLSFFLLHLASAIAQDEPLLFTPLRIPYNDLVNNKNSAHESLLEELTNVGMVSISELPDNFLELKEATLNWDFHKCVKSSESSKKFKYNDGTTRSTFATRTTSGLMTQEELTIKEQSSSECGAFLKKSQELRSVVHEVTLQFASVLSESTTPFIENEIITTIENRKEDELNKLNSISDVVQNSHHLEHFHSYEKYSESQQDTIDLHTDQGLFIVFTPGIILAEASDQKFSSSSSSPGFYIQLKNGSIEMVKLDARKDDLLIVLGDGIHQLNTHENLRSLPHSLRVPNSSTRVWYGRMVLLPSNTAYHHNDLSFGEIRENLNQNIFHEGIIGCSSNTMMARFLEGHENHTTISTLEEEEEKEETFEEECGENGSYCWHRCFNYTEEVSPEACAERSLEMACIDLDTGILWDPSQHNPSFSLECASLLEDMHSMEVMNETMSHEGHDPATSPDHHKEKPEPKEKPPMPAKDDGANVANSTKALSILSLFVSLFINTLFF